MTLAPQRGGWVVFASIVVAYMLTIVPLPEWGRLARPEWAALVLIYWCMAVPHRVGVIVAWLVGLGQDAVQATLLGQHALAYAIMAYLVLRLHQRIRIYPLPQQALIVLLLLLLVHVIQAWISALVDQPTPGMAYWLPPIVGTLIWPWVFILMRGVRRRFSVQ